MAPEFYLVLKDRDLTDQLADAVFEAGFDDSVLTIHGELAAIWICDREGELVHIVREAIAKHVPVVCRSLMSQSRPTPSRHD